MKDGANDTRQMHRINSEMIHPWSKAALLQKYSVRQSSKASLMDSAERRKELQQPSQSPKRKTLNTIRSYHEVASSMKRRASDGLTP